MLLYEKALGSLYEGRSFHSGTHAPTYHTQGGGGGGGTLIFSYICRLGSFLGFKILIFNIFWVFRKMNIFWSMKILWIFWVITNLDYI